MTTFCRRGDGLDDDAAPARLVDSAAVALETILLAAHSPPCHEVIALLLTSDYVGQTILVVDGTTSPDAVIEVLELIGESAAEAGNQHAVVLATVRPEPGPLPGDVDRWIELSEMADVFGCELLEWFVVGGAAAWCPRDLLVEPSRWPEPNGPVSW